MALVRKSATKTNAALQAEGRNAAVTAREAETSARKHAPLNDFPFDVSNRDDQSVMTTKKPSPAGIVGKIRLS